MWSTTERVAVQASMTYRSQALTKSAWCDMGVANHEIARKLIEHSVKRWHIYLYV